MTAVTKSPQRIQLMKAVKRSFAQTGWAVHSSPVLAFDFRVESGELLFFVKCLDETKIVYESRPVILDGLERIARELRGSGHRQLIVILDRNFLSIDLQNLIDREIVALTLDDIGVITSLSAISDKAPGAVTQRQAYLLERSITYSVFLSKLYSKNGDYLAAIQWGRHAVQHSVGFNYAYFSLFNILVDAREFEAATELGEKIRQYRPDDPQILRGMEDLARKRGNLAEAAEWHARLTEQPTTPRTLGEILAKQRAQNPPIPAAASPPPAPEPRPAERGIARLFKALRRSSTD